MLFRSRIDKAHCCSNVHVLESYIPTTGVHLLESLLHFCLRKSKLSSARSQAHGLKVPGDICFRRKKNATVAFEVVLYPNTTVANYVWSLFSARSGLTLRTLVKFGRAGARPFTRAPGVDPSQGLPRTKLRDRPFTGRPAHKTLSPRLLCTGALVKGRAPRVLCAGALVKGGHANLQISNAILTTQRYCLPIT